MKIHYFYKRNYSQGFYDLEIVAWLEEKETSRQGIERLSFTQLEKLRIFLSKSDQYHAHTIKHDFGKNSCYGHFAHTRKELYRRSNYDSVKGYSWIDFYLNDSPVPLFCTKTYKEDWHAFSEGILDEMQKVAMKWKTMNS